jgi:uncharacterized protein (DUF927 family)
MVLQIDHVYNFFYCTIRIMPTPKKKTATPKKKTVPPKKKTATPKKKTGGYNETRCKELLAEIESLEKDKDKDWYEMARASALNGYNANNCRPSIN